MTNYVGYLVLVTLIVNVVSLYFISAVIIDTFTFIMLISGAFHYQLGWFQDASRDHVIFTTVYVHIISLLFVLLLYRFDAWYWRVVAIAWVYGANYLLWKNGILYLSPHWSLVTITIYNCGAFLASWLINKYLLRSKKATI